jgi:hypothetical protein
MEAALCLGFMMLFTMLGYMPVHPCTAVLTEFVQGWQKKTSVSLSGRAELTYGKYSRV